VLFLSQSPHFEAIGLSWEIVFAARLCRPLKGALAADFAFNDTHRKLIHQWSNPITGC
jgi:hypothetical protein